MHQLTAIDNILGRMFISWRAEEAKDNNLPVPVEEGFRKEIPNRTAAEEP